MLRSTLFGLVIATVCVSQADAAYVIDTFANGSVNNTLSMNGASFSTTYNDGMATSIIGDTRKLDHFFDSEDDDPDFTRESRVRLNPPSGVLSFKNDPDVTARLNLTYEGVGGATGLNGLDLTQGGVDSFWVRLINTDLAANIHIIVTDMTGKQSSLDKNNLMPGIVVFGFGAFNALVPFNPADFTNAKSIVVEIAGTEPAIDLEIDFIEGRTVVPEPTSLALAGFAGIGMAVGAIRRRRQAKQAA